MPDVAVCRRCGHRHNPWGVHRGTEPSCAYDLWVDPDGRIVSVLEHDPAVGLDEDVAVGRLRRRVSDALGSLTDDELDTPTVALMIEATADGCIGPGYGPLGAPVELHRSLRSLLRAALDDLAAG